MRSTNQLGFGPEFLGRVRLVTSVASLLGVGIYNFYLKETPLRILFFWSNLLGMALGATQVRFPCLLHLEALSLISRKYPG